MQAAETAALADLGKRLTGLVGPVKIEGFAKPKSNLETLRNEVGFGKLDGLMLTTKRSDQDFSVLVATTRPLLDKWLQARAGDGDAPFASLQTPRRRCGRAISTASPSERTRPLPAPSISTSPSRPAPIWRWRRSAAGRRRRAPRRSTVSSSPSSAARECGSPTSPPATKISEIAACKPVWDGAAAEADKLSNAYQASEPKDEKLLDASERRAARGRRRGSLASPRRANRRRSFRR